jgi:ketosteroid isomerase-like protein
MEPDLENVRRYLDAVNEGGLDALVPFLDPEIEYREDPKFPQAAVYQGVDDVIAQWGEFFESFSDYRFETDELFSADGKVVVLGREIGHGAASGAPAERRTGWVYTLRDGKVARAEIFLDPDDAVAAVGGRPEPT